MHYKNDNCLLNIKLRRIMYNSKEKCDEEEDLYLSDIHIENEVSISINNDSNSNARDCRIEFSLPKNKNEKESAKSGFDEDGDLILNRRSNNNRHIFNIEFQMKTSLRNVGFQLWRASFFLGDFIIEHSDAFQGSCIVDLGAGLGITSLISSLFGRKVYCTDLPQIVEIGKRNFERNKQEIKEIQNDCELEFIGK